MLRQLCQHECPGWLFDGRMLRGRRELLLTYNNTQKLASEFVGTALLLATVVGSGIMGDTLSPNNTAIALLGNTIATGAILYVLITMFGPIGGAHFNPAVTLGFCCAKRLLPAWRVLTSLPRYSAASLVLLWRI